MTELIRALTRFFEQAGLPVALRGWTPADAPRPRLTLIPGDGQVTVECRFRSAARGGLSAHEQRLRAMDRVAALVPPGGKLLTFPGGAAVLRRPVSGFRALTEEPGAGGDTVGTLRFELWHAEGGCA